ncbi:hypothetical protein [Paenibacillus sp. FSL E2-0190]
MEYIEKNIMPLFKKYPLLSKFVLTVVIIDIVYYAGKQVGGLAYYLMH